MNTNCWDELDLVEIYHPDMMLQRVIFQTESLYFDALQALASLAAEQALLDCFDNVTFTLGQVGVLLQVDQADTHLILSILTACGFQCRAATFQRLIYPGIFAPQEAPPEAEA